MAALLLAFTPAAAAAAVIHVPTEQPTIQQAIAAASDGDTVLVAPGTYVENLDFLGKSITVTSEAGVEATVIDGDAAGSVVTFTTGETRAAVLDGFTLRNGRAGFDTPSSGSGGGIRIVGASPTVRNSAIVDNLGCSGVGVYVQDGSPLLQGNEIARNVQAGCSGGAGGGILLQGASAAEILDNLIADNVHGGAGAGIAMNGAGTPRIRGNVIRGNQTTSFGGGISLLNDSRPDIVQNLIIGNTAVSGGGLSFTIPAGAGLRLLNNTIAGNTASLAPAIFSRASSSPPLLVNNVVVAPAGQPALFCPDFSGSPPILRSNNVFTPSGPAYGGTCVDQTGQAGNVSADPLFVDPGQDDYRLEIGSPSVDAGDDAEPGLPDADLEGQLRIMDGNSDTVARVDMGAHEFNPTLSRVGISPASRDFGVVDVGTSAERAFTVRNTGGTPSVVTVSTASPFSLASSPTIALAPGALEQVLVRFQPANVGQVTGAVQFVVDGTSTTRDVRGTGVRRFTLTVARAGAGDLTVTSAPAGIACGGDCDERYLAGTPVSLTAVVTPPSLFGGWSGCDTASDTTCVVTLNANRTVTAVAGPPVTLAVAKAGTGSGTVVSAPPSIDCGPFCLARFGEASSVTLTAIPFPGSAFLGWGPACSGTGPCTLDMEAPRLVTATFARLPDLTLLALSAPATGLTGRPLVVTAVARNLGQVAATAFRITYFMSATDPAPGAGVAVGVRDLGGLAPGINASVVTTLTLPATLAAGTYFLSAVVDSQGVVAELDETNNGRTAVAPVAVSLYRPDLTIATLTAPATGQTGRPISLSALVRNVGSAPATAFRLTFFMSATDPTPGAGVALGFRDVAGLGAGLNASVLATVTVPLGAEAGAYHVSAVVDSRAVVTELGETNNGLTAPTQVTISLLRPDLTVAALVAPATAQTGRPLTASATLRNLGQVAAPAFRVTFYMSPTDPTPGAGTALGFRDLAGLVPGINASVVIALPVPIGFEPGAYYLSAVADTGGIVTELDETNNGRTAAATVAVSLLRSDLTITALTVPTTGQTGRPITVGMTLRNLGPIASPAFRVAFFMSPGDPTPGAGVMVGFRDVAALVPGVNASSLTILTVPIAFDPGAYYLSAVVDSGAIVVELGEMNNGLTAPTQVTISLLRSDLAVLALSAPATGQTGRPISVGMTVRNLGALAAPAFRVAFFMSATDPTPGAGTPVGFRDFAGLAPGVNASVVTVLTVPIGLDAGTYFVSAIVDSRAVVIELGEGNNGLTAPTQVTITLLRPDLTIAALSAPVTGQTGRPISVGMTVRNLGALAAPAFRVAFFMSATDPTPGAGTPVGFRDFPGLAPGVNASVVTALTIPIGLDAGAYFVSAIVDSRAVVLELGEGNNGLTAPTQVTITLLRPDLTIAALSAPATGQTGRPLAVTSTLRNLGQVAATAFRVTFFLSSGDPTPGAGTAVGVRDLAGLAPGVNASATTSVTIPAGLAPGVYVLSAVADSGGVVTELDETNNGRTAAGAVTVTLFRADLTVTALSGPAAGVAIAGRPVTITSTVRNAGRAPAGAFRVAFYLSADATLDPGDIPLGTRAVAGLAADGLSTAASSVVIPPLTPPFDYYVIATVDDLQAVPELTEGDNARVTATTLAVVPNMVRTYNGSLTLQFSACTDPELNNNGSGAITFRVPTQTGRAFSGSTSFTEVQAGLTIVTTLTAAGMVDVRGAVTGTVTLRTVTLGIVVFSSTATLSGEVFGPSLSGSFAGLLSVFTGDSCQLSATFALF